MTKIIYAVLTSFLVQISYAQLPNKIIELELISRTENPWEIEPASKSPVSYPQKIRYYDWDNDQWKLIAERIIKYNRFKLITENILMNYQLNEATWFQYSYNIDKVVSFKVSDKNEDGEWRVFHYDTSYLDQNGNIVFNLPYVHYYKTNDSTKYTYKYDSQNRIVEQYTEKWNLYYGDSKGTTFVEYDAQNRIISWNNRKFFYNATTGLMDSIYDSTWRHYFTYDSSGKLIYYEKHGSTNPNVRYSLLKYNSEGRLIERTVQRFKNGAWEDYRSVLITPFPNNGFELVFRDYQNGNWIESGYLKKKYDDKNNLILYSWINPIVDGTSYSYEIKYLYDDDDRILEEETLRQRTDNVWELTKIVYSDLLPEPIPLPDAFTLYPNPANGHIRLHADTPGPVDIQIYDMSGRLMIHNPAYEFGYIYIDQLERGAYFVRVKMGEDIVVKKFIKM